MVERASLDKMLGTMVGRYRLEQLLEQHPWGPVFLARSSTEGAVQGKYVVRLLQSTTAISQDARLIYLGRFQQEANRIARLQHAAILPLLDYGNVNGVPYLVYPQVSAISLRALLAQQGALALPIVGSYLEQLAAALDYAHGQAVIHRSLSTNSVFVQKNQQLVITDFGIAYIFELSKQFLPGSSTTVYEGSSESSAPEQLQGGPITAATDVYATGAVLFRLLTAQPPFSGKTRQAIEQQHLSAPVPSVKAWRADLPSALNDVVAKAMAKQPERRFSSVGELFNAYQRIVDPEHIKQAVAPLAAPQPSGKQPAVAAAPVAPPVAPRQASTKAGSVSRRQVITILAAGGGVAAAALIVANSHLLGNTASPAATTSTTTTSTGNSAGAGTSSNAAAHTGNVIAHTADIPLNSAKTFPISGQSNPGILVHLPDNKFVAFDSTCTHAGCAVDYVAQSHQLLCPCHSAVFDPAKNAAVIKGPAPTPLAAIKIVVNSDGTITTV